MRWLDGVTLTQWICIFECSVDGEEATDAPVHVIAKNPDITGVTEQPAL